jgi:hypothetical protein
MMDRAFFIFFSLRLFRSFDKARPINHIFEEIVNTQHYHIPEQTYCFDLRQVAVDSYPQAPAPIANRYFDCPKLVSKFSESIARRYEAQKNIRGYADMFK